MSKSGYTREYLGVTVTASNYSEILKTEGRRGINFHTKHLKCYLRGDTYFTFGKDEKGNPALYVVQEKLTEVPKVTTV